MCPPLKRKPSLPITILIPTPSVGAVVVRFASKEAEEAYRNHPVHVHVRDTLIKPLLVPGKDGTPSVLAMDYEFAAKSDGWMRMGNVAAGLAVTFAVGFLLGRRS